ncbi:MAG TPA: DUF2203 domain-containing protein [Pyrinomonadaceae bacterium]|nr:DUF2203 domain-containing protein [Pyrinomonadaceae bacterium]HMP64024.1 DUF2203 domain-containing protein [Pyrinomonadaceae bacterium]
MKLFTVQEANAELPRVRLKLEMIRRLYERVSGLKASAKAAAEASEFGGGMRGGSGYVKALYDIGKLTTEIAEQGIQIKDYKRGLIDFPAIRNSRTVLLCWQLGEPDEIRWWHEVDEGFAGRRPL